MSRQKLVLVSMDALIFEDLAYLADKPAFRHCMQEGARVERVRSIYPTLTYPCHATMATGCLPSVHGIINNTFFSPGVLSPDWLWFHDAYQVRDLCDAAKEAGLTTACIGWPTMGNHPHADYLVGEIAGTKAQTTEEFRAQYQRTGTTDQLWDAVCQPHIHFRSQQRDVGSFNACVACEIIRRYAPDLTLIHLGEPDHTRHSSGLFGKEVFQALDKCERQLEQLLQAIQDSGEAEHTNLVITADHGHMDYSRFASPNVLLAQNGFLELDEDGGVRSWRAWCANIGLCAAVYVKDPADESAVFTLLKQWEGQGFSRIYTRDEAAREGFSGPFSFVLETDDRTAFRDHWTGDYLTPVPGPRSGHGFHPDKGPRPTLIALGPAFRKGVVLPHAQLTDGAPTWAAVLGLELPDAQGSVLAGLLNSRP